MSNRLSRMSYLKNAGLGTALTESALIGDCSNSHSEMAKNRGWKFCAHCGMELVVVATCPTCKHTFYSAAAWKMHKSRHRPTCPKCKNHVRIQVLPRGLKFKMGSQGGGSGRTNYRCGTCGSLFRWNQTTLTATELELDSKENSPLSGKPFFKRDMV